jgi:ABC-type multidrug transport system fused ATPase/permease subunit
LLRNRKQETFKIGLDENDALIRAMQKELDSILIEETHEELSQFAKTRTAMTMVLWNSVQTQRLYFVVRSVIMSLISALIYFTVVLYLGSIDAVQAALVGVFVFIIALIASRLFDKQIVAGSKKIIRYLNKYERIRAFVLRRL